MAIRSVRRFMSTAVSIAFVASTFLSCNSERKALEGRVLRLEAGKRTFVLVEIPDGAAADSISVVPPDAGVQLILPGGRAGVSAFLVRCTDGDVEGRLSDLSSSEGLIGAETERVDIQGDESDGFEAIMYSESDSCFVERLWSRGGGEALVLRINGEGDTPRALLGMAQPILSGASAEEWPGLRSVSLSNRSSEQIRAGLEQEDVTLPPQIHHSLRLGIEPGDLSLSVADSFSVDFSATPGLDSTSFFLPHVDADATEEVMALEGSCSREADSLICVPDSASRIFRGAYSALFDGFYVEKEGSVHGQVRLSSSFCCGEWIYPGSPLPSSYEIVASVPSGTRFYCPLVASGVTSADGRSLFGFVSPEGGIISPLPWAAADFTERSVASGRSRVLFGPGLDEQAASQSLVWADRLASSLWDRLGFEGAMLDFVMLEGIGAPVYSWGPGCVMISPDIMSSLEGHSLWSDTLASGMTPRGPRIVARAARSMLLFSTYLPDEVADALSAYSVYVFEESWGTAGSADSLLEAFRLYYLDATEAEGGTEHSIADPMLDGTSLSGPVLLGKAPLVFEMFSDVLPGFDSGLVRGLSSLRHSGYCYGRIASAAGLDGEGDSGFFWDWLYQPGVPQICVDWADSADMVFVRIEQLQPGNDFPLPSPGVRVDYSRGLPAIDYLAGPDERGFYTTPSYPWRGRVVSIQLWPGMVLPADIVYERLETPGL